MKRGQLKTYQANLLEKNKYKNKNHNWGDCVITIIKISV